MTLNSWPSSGLHISSARIRDMHYITHGLCGARTKPKVSCMIRKHSTNWSTFPTHIYGLLFINTNASQLLCCRGHGSHCLRIWKPLLGQFLFRVYCYHGSITPSLRKCVEPRKFPVSTIQFSDFPGSIIEFAKLLWLLLLQEQWEP